MIQIMDQQGAGMVCGDRLGQRGELRGEMPLTRWLGNRFFVGLVKLLYRRQIQDGCSGQRIFKNHFKKQFCALRSNDLNYSLAMTLYCLRHGIHLVETRVRYQHRIGFSKLFGDVEWSSICLDDSFWLHRLLDGYSEKSSL